MINKMIFGILGKKGHGKDTVSDYLVENYGFEKEALATPLKNACREIFNFTDEQLYTNLKEEVDPYWGIKPRIILQWLGTDVLRKEINKIIPGIDDNIWINSLILKYKNKQKDNPNLDMVVSDCRFPNEIRELHKLGCIIIKINRPSLVNNDEHESEKNIDLIKDYDYEIINDGTLDELYDKIDKIMNKYNYYKKY